MCLERLTTSTAIPQTLSHSNTRSRGEPEHRAPDCLHIAVALDAKLRVSMFGVGDLGAAMATAALALDSGSTPLVEGR